ncbi:hypothetical protein FDB53_04160 [Clostridium botulinum]|nr:hypothetical protein [Clostridium botulinum]
MYNLENIQKKAEYMLAYFFKLSDIDAMRKYVNQKFIINYEELLNQTIFEIYYENYSKYSEREPISKMFKNENEEDLDLASNKDYKKTQRTYKMFRTHNDALSIKHNNGRDVEYVELEEEKDRFEGHKIKKYQQNQISDLNEFKIFKYILKGRIGDSKSVSNDNLIKALEDIDKVYDRINKKYNNYFERSVQYYQLELSCRIETSYLIADAICKINKSLEEKNNDIETFKVFWAVNCNGDSLQNKFILGIKKYLDKYIENSTVIELIQMEIYELNLIKYHARKAILAELDNKNICLDFNECSNFFKEFFGEMQHVNKNKKWDSKVLINFRKNYKD